MVRSYGSGLQLHVIRVACNDTLLLSQCKNLFQQIYTHLAGRELWIAGVHWKAFSQEH
ncbi:hypothetical protein M407DRAFT_244948 [Tulasnella calospora MUT 4182]|uniref:Uncharacterized protein n=1 Tax=Tulasnella calospora MUT 4182 TaxID=1051891 RepID=A0A0C3Q338_9AGAM|nr:hypothetical protein M407DRAFT_244948 [Tulasnella calospora MUT 4182]